MSPRQCILAAACALALFLGDDVGLLAATTQPSIVTLDLQNVPAKQAVEQLSRIIDEPIILTPADLLSGPDQPRVTLKLQGVPFWAALKELGRQTGIEPVNNGEEPVLAGRLQLGLGGGKFWKSPHTIAGPLILFPNDVQRNVTVELGKPSHRTERSLTIDVAAHAEPGLRILATTPLVKVKQAVDDKGNSLLQKDDNGPAAADDPTQGLETLMETADQWNFAVQLHCPANVGARIASVRGLVKLRIQTRSQRIEVADPMKARNVARTIGGAGITFKNLKKADGEYNLQIALKRKGAPEVLWKNLCHSLSGNALALYDAKGRLIARSDSSGVGEESGNTSDVAVRFVRQPGIGDPEAGEPAKVVWDAPLESRDLEVEFVLTDVPIPR